MSRRINIARARRLVKRRGILVEEDALRLLDELKQLRRKHGELARIAGALIDRVVELLGREKK